MVGRYNGNHSGGSITEQLFIYVCILPTLQGPLCPLHPVNLSYSNGGHGGEIKKSYAFFICPPEISASYRQAFFGGQIKKAKDFFMSPPFSTLE